MKKLTSIFLCLVIMLTVVPITAMAQSDTVQQPISAEMPLTMSGTNSVGTLLTDALTDELDEQQQNSGNVIYSVEVNGADVYADISTAVSATIVVGIYTEDETRLISSCQTEVTPQDSELYITLPSAVPQYFIINAYLIDSETLAPVSAVYHSVLYTKEMQEFLAKTTADFEEERVINFDDDETNNFAVLGEDVTVIDEESAYNKITFADFTADIYRIENIDETVASLKPGDTFSGVYNGESVIVKIGEISFDGSSATVLGTETDLETIFDYVKLDSSCGISEDAVDTSVSGEGVTFEGCETSGNQRMRGVDIGGQVGADAKFSIDFTKKGPDNKNVRVSGNLKLKLIFSAKIYISSNYKYFEVKFEYQFGGNISVSGMIEFFSVPLGKLKFHPVPAITSEITASFVGKFSGSFEVGASLLKGTLGFGWYSDVGSTNLSSTPKLEVEAKGEITVFIGFKLESTLKILEGYLCEATLESTVGGEAKATLSYNTSDIFSSSVKHDCKNCVKGEIYGKFDLKVKGKLLKHKKLKLDFKIVEVKWKLYDFYWSIDHGDYGFTTCPHKSYKLTVIVTDEKGNALKDAAVTVGENTLKTEADGTATVFLRNGSYDIVLAKSKYQSDSKKVDIHNAAKAVNITLKKVSAVTVSLDYSHSAAVTENGDLYTWGDNEDGEIGDGTTTDRRAPVKVLSNVKQVSLEFCSSAAVTENGDLYTWGYNRYGHLGDGTKTNRRAPVKVLSGVKQVSLKYFHSAAITENGDLYTWGDNRNSQLGDGTKTDRLTPVKVLSGVRQVSLGQSHSAAVTETGDLYTWGWNYYGQLGDGTTTTRPAPVKVLSGVKQVSLEGSLSAAITENGDLYTWGWNHLGQLGDGTTTDRSTPVKILSGVRQVSLGEHHCAAITESGDLYTWGYNVYGGLGDGTTTTRPAPVKVLSGVKQVSFGLYYSAAVTETGDLYTWGRNESGGLGDGTTTNSSTPVKVLSGVVQVSLGCSHSAAVTETGDLYTWGYNYNGRLGDGTTTRKLTPTYIMNLKTGPSAASKARIVKSALRLAADSGEEALQGMKTSTFSGLTPNMIYNFYLLRDRDCETPLANENIYYIFQGKADSNGDIAFTYSVLDENGALRNEITQAEGFVVAFKNALPDYLCDNLSASMSRADELTVTLSANDFAGAGFASPYVKLTVGSDEYSADEFTMNAETISFTCKLPERLFDSQFTVCLYAQSDSGILYESKTVSGSLLMLRCDLNGDGIANAIDLSELFRKLLLEETVTVGDINADGSTDIRDLIALKKILASI